MEIQIVDRNREGQANNNSGNIVTMTSTLLY